MKHLTRITKGLLIFAGIAGLCQGILLWAILYPVPVILKFLDQFIWLHYLELLLVILMVVGFICILSFIMITPSEYNNVSYKTQKGVVKVPKAALEKMILNQLVSHYALEEIDVRIHWSGQQKKTRAKIRARSKVNGSLAKECQAVEQMVKKELQTAFALPVEKVSVKLQGIATEHK